MPTISLDGPNVSGLVWTFNCYQRKHTRDQYGMLSHSPVYFKDQHMSCRTIKVTQLSHFVTLSMDSGTSFEK
jgi:hypothetical protein